MTMIIARNRTFVSRGIVVMMMTLAVAGCFGRRLLGLVQLLALPPVSEGRRSLVDIRSGLGMGLEGGLMAFCRLGCAAGICTSKLLEFNRVRLFSALIV